MDKKTDPKSLIYTVYVIAHLIYRFGIDMYVYILFGLLLVSFQLVDAFVF